MASKSFNVAVIGYGMSAKVFHIPLITVAPALVFHSIVQRHPTLDNDAQKDHPGIKVYNSSEEMVKNPSIDVVVITTIPTSHFELCKLALEHRKHVVVEKPFTPTSKEAGELIAIAEKHERLLTVYQNRRWDADFLTLSALLKEGRLGRVVEFETHFDRHRPEAPAASSNWKARPLPGGGAAYDLGTHLIDQVVVLFGLPDRITGFVGSQRKHNPENIEDSCTILLHYQSRRLLATVKAGVVSPDTEQLRFWIRGEKGSYKKFHLDCQEDQLKAGQKPGDPGFGIEPEEHAGTFTYIVEGQSKRESYPNIEPATYKAFYTQFANALAGEGNVPVKPETARNVIRLIELARRSSAKGRTLRVGEQHDGID